jgi:UDP-N-acetyl-D-glucosamine dehydrogenase
MRNDPTGETAVSASQKLLQLIEKRQATVGIVGLGYVGIPLALAACRAGFPVLGFDIDGTRVQQINGGLSAITHIPDTLISGPVEAGRLSATADFSRLSDADAILICVPTPLTRHREPEMRYVEETARAISASLRIGHLVVLESTTYPGTTDDLVRPILERSGLRSGIDFFLAYSPEREDPGNPNFGTASIPKVVGGQDEIALEVAVALYDALVVRTVRVSSTGTAEAVKLTENIFRAVNIALVNELKVIYERMGVDIWEVIEAAKTKPFGFMPFYPGPGLGGHCIPIDPFYLTWKAREFEINTRFIELAGEINTQMPHYVVEKTIEAVDKTYNKGLSACSVLLIGLSYKKNVDDIRESPSLKLIELLEARGAKSVDYHDPYVKTIKQTREYMSLAGRRSVCLNKEAISRYDVVLIATDHDNIDYLYLVQHARLIVDTRNACARAGAMSKKVFKA